ncbi:ubiquitin-protein ligase [Lithospermum erythrorhizon]|uniref:RING-type E3 ubiquitin transferase n=1 Tax=Lithospermum erythrorhizon TaxID=34254 RepID=A0AAV3QSV1_LITER
MASQLNHQTNLSQYLPFILAFTNNDENNSNPIQDSPNHNQDRIILINPVTQDTIVIESSSSMNLDSLFNDFFNNQDGQPPASKSSIEAMQSLETNEFNTKGECVVCLEEWKVGQMAKEMPCKHRFHRECIEKWLEIHGTCPVCRYNMPVEDDQDWNKKNENRRGSMNESSDS